MTELAHFATRVGQAFSVEVGLPEPLEIVLFAANPMPARKPVGRSDPFELRFRGRGPYCLKQWIHRLRNDALGEMDIFLVPIAQEDDHFIYQAVFS
ncbi:DUF6916 family protein [Ancylobacter lacus]|uniref:DUF6916 family protein n=1 Tax=Ancylobacter lacus TaxID=2579970 RepID=UPI001FE2B22B|nr:hypothetical protein [Ancylobacter lacus]